MGLQRNLGTSQFGNPYALAVDPTTNNLLVSDLPNNRIQVFNSSGGFVTIVGTPTVSGNANGEFQGGPEGLAVDPSGNIYVSDTGNSRVQVFDSSYNYVAQWGGLGSADGQFNYNFGIAADSGATIYVAEENNSRFQVFTSGGTFVRKWTPGYLPSNVAVDASGNIFANDLINGRIYKYNSSGVQIGAWGNVGSGPGQFTYPRGIGVNSAGEVYVADGGNNRVQKFSNSGTYLGEFGGTGSGPGQFNGPVGSGHRDPGHNSTWATLPTITSRSSAPNASRWTAG